MEIQTIKPSFPFGMIAFLMFSIVSISFGQEKYIPNFKSCCYNYISASYVRGSGIEGLTINPYYKRDLSTIQTVRLDIGAQLSNRIAIDFGFTHTPLWLKKELTIDDKFIYRGGSSNANISFYTFRLTHNLPIKKEKILFTSGLGYALGKSKVGIGTIGPSNPNTYTDGDITYTETSTRQRLSGGTVHFLTMDMGLEFLVLKKFNLFTKISYFKGFKDLQQQQIDYVIMGDEGTVNITNDGSFVGLEIGLKFKFFPYFMTPVRNKVRNILGLE